MNLFWQQMQRELALQLEALKSLRECPDHVTPESFDAWEEPLRDVVDAQCLFWVRRGHWPDSLTAAHAWLVSLRICQALPHALLLCTSHWDENPSRMDALDWLLVDAWPMLAPRAVADLRVPADSGLGEMPAPWLE